VASTGTRNDGKRDCRRQEDELKGQKVRAGIFLGIAAVFVVVAIFSGGGIKLFLSGVIAMVCGLLGFLHLKGEDKPRKKRR
jgi:hypothetical protein